MLAEAVASAMREGRLCTAATIHALQRHPMFDVVTSMEPYLTGVDEKNINVGMFILGKIATSRHLNPTPSITVLNPEEYLLIIRFLVERCRHFATQPIAIETLLNVVTDAYQSLGLGDTSSGDDDDVIAPLETSHVFMCEVTRFLAQRLLTNIHTQSLVISTKRQIFSFLELLLTSSKRQQKVTVEIGGSDFVRNFIEAVDEERDPVLVRTLFQLSSTVVEIFPDEDLSFHVEEMFEMCSAYFPVLFTPPPSCTVTRADLRDALHVFLCHPMFHEQALPFLATKLSSPAASAKHDSLEVISTIFSDKLSRYSNNNLFPQVPNLLAILRGEVLKLNAVQERNEEAQLLLRKTLQVMSSIAKRLNQQLAQTATEQQQQLQLSGAADKNILRQDQPGWIDASTVLSLLEPILSSATSTVEVDSSAGRSYATMLHAVCLGGGRVTTAIASYMIPLVVSLTEKASVNAVFPNRGRRLENGLATIGSILSAAEQIISQRAGQSDWLYLAGRLKCEFTAATAKSSTAGDPCITKETLVNLHKIVVLTLSTESSSFLCRISSEVLATWISLSYQCSFYLDGIGRREAYFTLLKRAFAGDVDDETSCLIVSAICNVSRVAAVDLFFVLFEGSTLPQFGVDTPAHLDFAIPVSSKLSPLVGDKRFAQFCVTVAAAIMPQGSATPQDYSNIFSSESSNQKNPTFNSSSMRLCIVGSLLTCMVSNAKLYVYDLCEINESTFFTEYCGGVLTSLVDAVHKVGGKASNGATEAPLSQLAVALATTTLTTVLEAQVQEQILHAASSLSDTSSASLSSSPASAFVAAFISLCWTIADCPTFAQALRPYTESNSNEKKIEDDASLRESLTWISIVSSASRGVFVQAFELDKSSSTASDPASSYIEKSLTFLIDCFCNASSSSVHSERENALPFSNRAAFVSLLHKSAIVKQCALKCVSNLVGGLLSPPVASVQGIMTAVDGHQKVIAAQSTSPSGSVKVRVSFEIAAAISKALLSKGTSAFAEYGDKLVGTLLAPFMSATASADVVTSTALISATADAIGSILAADIASTTPAASSSLKSSTPSSLWEQRFLHMTSKTLLAEYTSRPSNVAVIHILSQLCANAKPKHLCSMQDSLISFLIQSFRREEISASSQKVSEIVPALVSLALQLHFAMCVKKRPDADSLSSADFTGEDELTDITALFIASKNIFFRNCVMSSSTTAKNVSATPPSMKTRLASLHFLKHVSMCGLRAMSDSQQEAAAAIRGTKEKAAMGRVATKRVDPNAALLTDAAIVEQVMNWSSSDLFANIAAMKTDVLATTHVAAGDIKRVVRQAAADTRHTWFKLKA